MNNKKPKLNWYFLIAGTLILYFGLTTNQTKEQIELKKISVELNKEIINVKGRRKTVDYRFWVREYKNRFVILNGSISGGKHEKISNLNGGELLDVYISNADFANLNNIKKDITVRGLYLEGKPLLTTIEFYNNRDLYKLRLKTFSVFISIMLIINGLIKIPRKTNYLIIGIFGIAILVMRVFEIGIY